MIDKAQLLGKVKLDPSLIAVMDLGLSDVTDEREVRFQIPASPYEEEWSGRGKGKPFHSVYLRRGRRLKGGLRYDECSREHHDDPASWESEWYRIQNGWASGYVSDSHALSLYVQGGEQLELIPKGEG